MRMRWYSFRRRALRFADGESRLCSRRVRRRERLRILRSGDVGAVDELWGKVVRVMFALPDLLEIVIEESEEVDAISWRLGCRSHAMDE